MVAHTILLPCPRPQVTIITIPATPTTLTPITPTPTLTLTLTSSSSNNNSATLILIPDNSFHAASPRTIHITLTRSHMPPPPSTFILHSPRLVPCAPMTWRQLEVNLHAPILEVAVVALVPVVVVVVVVRGEGAILSASSTSGTEVWRAGRCDVHGPAPTRAVCMQQQE